MTEPERPQLDAIHHVAVPVTDLARAVGWYTSRFSCRVLYQDATWAMLEFANVKVALVMPAEHPAHIAFVNPEAESFGPLTEHRDETRSIYIQDPDGNSVEIMAAESLGPGSEAEKKG